MRSVALWSAVGIVAVMAACGAPASEEQARPRSKPSPTETGAAPEKERPHDLDRPPPVTIHFFDESLELEAWTYCYGNVCADGAPPEDPAHVGGPDHVVVEFPEEGWDFDATFTPAGQECGRNQRVNLKSMDDGRFLLEPAGYAGEYDVTLFGRGNGDLFVTFRWTTPSDGPLPEPKARTAILADHDGAVDSYGVELEVSNLASTPKRAAATITVESENGESVSFKAKRARGNCWPEGTVYWDGPDDEGLEAAQLDGDSFIYKIELMLDGERYVATARWPEEQIRGFAPSVPLDFTPELPGLS